MPDNLRTSILIQDGERGKLSVQLTGTPSSSRPGSRLDAKLPQLKTPKMEDDAAAYGLDLQRNLFTPRELKRALASILTAPDGQVWPLCFKIEVKRTAVERKLLLEMLWVKDHEFLALQPKWPIARVGDTRTSRARVFHAPVRVLAVMSALGVSAREDWNGLRRAVESAREIGLQVHVTAIVGEKSLLKDLQDLVEAQDASDDPVWLTAVGLQDQQTIEQHLVGKPVHILHFFCHGLTAYGGWSLSLATSSDQRDYAESAGGDPADPETATTGSVVVNLPTLKNMVSGCEPWLVTLNCCSSAATATQTQTQSLAQDVVEAGAGAAMGWRTPVSPEQANVLSRTLFNGVFREIHERIKRAQQYDRLTVEFATLGYDLRNTLHNDYPDASWTLPVLYVAPDPLTVIAGILHPDNPTDLAMVDVSASDSKLIGDIVTRQVLQDFTDGMAGLGLDVSTTVDEATIELTEDDKPAKDD